MIAARPKFCSGRLKLWLTTSPRLCLNTYCSAAIIAAKPPPFAVSATGVSTSRIFAPGAISCASSTSPVVSPALSSRSWSYAVMWVGSITGKGGIGPSGAITRKGGGPGKAGPVVKGAQTGAVGGGAVGVDDDDRAPAPVVAPPVQRLQAIG